MAIECPKCQTHNPPGSKFCLECATPLPKIDEAIHTKTLETPSKELATGSVFANRYQVIEELGKGGMGKVYRVLDKKLNEEVALKLIKPEIASDKMTLERFKNELKLARKVAQKNVGRMFDLGEETGTHYITMEYVPGEDLKSFIRRVGQIPIGKSITIAKQLCEGLSEAHSIGIVHRDLKPSNFMIDKDGNVRIMDFGIARSLKGKALTGAGVIIGTPEYMSPEQVEGKEVDQRSDLYSLGVVLYEMGTGKVPFEGDAPLSVAVRQKTEQPADPREFNPQIPVDLSQIILRCMEKDKGRRYSNAGELYADLMKIEQGIPATARTVSKKKPLTSKEITVTFGLRKLIVPVLAVLAIAATAVVLLTGHKPDVDPDLVAVAVFENGTGDPSQDMLGRMVADQITAGLSQTGQIGVVPILNILQSSWIDGIKSGRTQGPDQLRALGEETGAGTLVSGIYYLKNSVLQFHANITDVLKGKIRASFSVEGSKDEWNELIDDLVQRVMGHLTPTPYFLGKAWESAHRPSFEALQEYVSGMEYFGSDYDRALQHLERAAALDPEYMAPRLRMATIYGNRGEQDKRKDIVDFVDLHREKLTPLERNELDWTKVALQGKTEDCYRIWLKAEEIAPRDAIVRYMVGAYAVRTNRPERALVAFTKYGMPEAWHDFMPGVWWHRYLSYAYHMLGNYKKELKSVRSVLQYYPNVLSLRTYEVRALAAMGKVEDINKVIDESIPVRSVLGTAGGVMREAGLHLRLHGYREASFQVLERAVDWYKSRPDEELGTQTQQSGLADALYKAERSEEAEAIYEALHEDFPEDVDYLGYLGALAARTGRSGKALEISEQLGDISRPYIFGRNTFWRARIAVLLGEKENALRLLREALEQGVYYWSLYIDMDLEPLRDDKDFQELIKPKG